MHSTLRARQTSEAQLVMAMARANRDRQASMTIIARTRQSKSYDKMLTSCSHCRYSNAQLRMFPVPAASTRRPQLCVMLEPIKPSLLAPHKSGGGLLPNIQIPRTAYVPFTYTSRIPCTASEGTGSSDPALEREGLHPSSLPRPGRSTVRDPSYCRRNRVR